MRLQMNRMTRNQSLWSRLALLVLALLLGLILFLIVSMLTLDMYKGGGQAAINIHGLRWAQGLQQLLVFALPSLLLCCWFGESPCSFLHLRKVPVGTVLLAMLSILSAIPVINVLVEWNEGMQLPEALSGIENWMRVREDEALAITDALLATTSWNDFFINLIVIALLAALGEELLFRGVLLSLFMSPSRKSDKAYLNYGGDRTWMSAPESGASSRRVHVAIWLTAFLFSLGHLQFYGFVPRFLLGAWLGYLLWWSGSILVPMAAHFTNNAMALFFSFAEKKAWLPEDFGDTIGSGDSWWTCLLSMLLLSIISFYFVRKQRA